jgi:hypothetical protein
MSQQQTMTIMMALHLAMDHTMMNGALYTQHPRTISPKAEFRSFALLSIFIASMKIESVLLSIRFTDNAQWC